MTRTMRTAEQIVGILQEHEAGAKCADFCRKLGMSEGTFSAWKAKHSGMTVSEGRQCCAIGPSDHGDAAEGAGGREREAEAVAGRADARHGGDARATPKMVTPAVKREAVAHLKAHLGLSEQQALSKRSGGLFVARLERAGLPGRTPRWCTTKRNARRTRRCGTGCGIWPRNGAGSATGGSSCC